MYIGNTKINNVPNSAYKRKYWVVRDCGTDGKWFYGAWDNIKKAAYTANIIGNGFVYSNNLRRN